MRKLNKNSRLKPSKVHLFLRTSLNLKHFSKSKKHLLSKTPIDSAAYSFFFLLIKVQRHLLTFFASSTKFSSHLSISLVSGRPATPSLEYWMRRSTKIRRFSGVHFWWLAKPRIEITPFHYFLPQSADSKKMSIHLRSHYILWLQYHIKLSRKY